ncbi:hypothetical protein Hanom_Chr10g00894841 [Helianthus anomalus]
MQNHYQAGVLLEALSLFLRVRDKVVYILPSSDTILALLFVRFTEYDDNDDSLRPSISATKKVSLTQFQVQPMLLPRPISKPRIEPEWYVFSTSNFGSS